MAELDISISVSNGQTTDQSMWNTAYSEIETWLNNRYNGTDTWLNMNVTATAANPVTIKSSGATTEVAIDNTASDGDPILDFKLSGTAIITMGVDDSDSDIFKIGTTSITTNVAMQIPTAGVQVQFANGTAALPSVAFINDPDCGIFRLNPNNLAITIAGASVVDIRATEIVQLVTFNPNGAGGISTGDASNYWNDISYKTLTDRGCLPWCDDGVELSDGRVVTDLEALKSIQKHPTKQTIHGLPMLDYKTFPKKSYTLAATAQGLLPRDANDEPIGGSDGVEMTMMFGVFIGAMKELANRIEALENK